MTLRFNTLLTALFLASSLALTGCDTSEGGNEGVGGVGGVGGSDVGGFLLSSVSVPPNFTQKINRAVTFTFTRAIDFSSVSLNSISIRDSNNFPANGVFSFDPANPRVLVFQPTCPVESDFSDAGFLPGGQIYTITVVGKDSASGTSVVSSTGEELKESLTRTFFTPGSTDLVSLFEDLVSGAPQPVIRPLGSSTLDASFIEVAQDSTIANRIYFERMPDQSITQPGSQDGSIPDGHPLESLELGMPLNLYSDQNSKVAFVVEVNQPVNPSPTNINSNRIRIEAEKTLNVGDFTPVASTVELVRNCTTTGATLRIQAVGVLPQNVNVRIVIDASFEDLIGNNNSAALTNFGQIRTRNAGAALADELLEEFTLSAASAGSLEDDAVAFPVPRAIWGKDGTLQPRFDFDGTGGPTGAFDFIVRGTGGPVVIDTTFQPISDANQTLQQIVINGRMDVRNFTIETGGVLQLKGPNPMVINATGNVRIDGTIEMLGATAKDVTGVFTATFPEPGATGNLGGGKGGDASTNKTSSTPKGDNGDGAFGLANGGGGGGETGFGAGLNDNTANKIQNAHPRHRRGGAGGGGVFGGDASYAAFPVKPATIGTLVQPGGSGDSLSTSLSLGALSGLPIPAGGVPGHSLFVDGDDDNDFFGVNFDATTMELTQGELMALHAGSGGGGAGDGVRSLSFPNPTFSNSSEDKGGAGGGGSGGFLLRVLGDVAFGPAGRIVADGGAGARGQLIQFNGNFFVKSGGGGGGGSGGHVVIETGGTIDFGAGLDVISARGGKGGPGNKNQAQMLNSAGGGNGGPGIVQLHTPNGFADIFANGAAITSSADVDLVVIPFADFLLPNFGAISRARSNWISLGGAVGDNPDDVTFLFDGTDMAGLMENSGGLVTELNSIVGPGSLNPAGTAALVDNNTFSFDFTDTNTDFEMNDVIYRDNPVLMKNFVLLFREIANPTSTFRRYNIASAMVDPANANRMILTTETSGLAFTEFVTVPGIVANPLPAFADPADVEFVIVPRFFRVVTSGLDNRLPVTSSIKILFEGTGRDVFGNPESTLLVTQTADITELSNPALSKPVEFFRFEVEFNIDSMTNGLSASSPRPALEFLRMPFQF